MVEHLILHEIIDFIGLKVEELQELSRQEALSLLTSSIRALVYLSDVQRWPNRVLFSAKVNLRRASILAIISRIIRSLFIIISILVFLQEQVDLVEVAAFSSGLSHRPIRCRLSIAI